MPGLWGQLRSLGFLSDEEMGKKDADHRLAKDHPRTPQWQPARVPPRRVYRRIAVLSLIFFTIWLVFRYDILGLSPQGHRALYYSYPHDQLGYSLNLLANHPSPSKSQDRASSKERTYNGPVKFLNLAESLHLVAGTSGGLLQNKNVLFAASSLQSASALLPIACEMGRELRSYVHFALMSRNEVDIQEVMNINGIDESCNLILHGMN
jgi:hypothetical protein